MTAARIDVLVITALFDELGALLAVEHGGESWTLGRDPSGFPYHVTQIGPLWIAAAWAGEMGVTAAATRATALIGHLDPACLAMCGICAGNRGEVFLGDVIVADRVYSYDHGKLVAAEDPGGRREERFFHDITTYNLDAVWRVDAAYFAEDRAFREEMMRARPPSRARQEAWLRHRLFDHARGIGPSPVDDPARRERCPDWKNRIHALMSAGLVARSGGKLSLTKEGERLVEEERLDYPDHPDGHPGDPPFRVHVGPIATGSTVRKDPEIFARLERLVRKTTGIEMEAAAVGRVADELHRKAIVVKAVSDYGDHDKDDAYRGFAARASAEILLRFLCRNLSAALARAPGSAPAAELRGPVAELREPGSPAENPFRTAGSLPPGHPTYMVRACDSALADRLREGPLVAVEGGFSMGKSSLVLKARAELASTHRACYVDLQDLRCDDDHIFSRDFFDQISQKTGQKVDSWPRLDDGAGLPLALIIDELGCLSARAAQSFIPALVHFATSRKERVRVIACLPVRDRSESIESFLRARGLENKKHWREFRRVLVPPLEAAGIEELLSLLPARARGLAREHAEVIEGLSGGHPMAVQRVCSALFDADREGASVATLKAILGARGSYE